MNKTLLAGLVVALLSSAAQARDVASGTLMVTGDSNVLDSSSKSEYSNGGSATDDETKINLASFYFPVQNVGVGVVLVRDDTKHSTNVVQRTTVNAIGPGAGYNISLNQDMGLMLHAEYLLASGSVDDGYGNTADIDGHGYQFGGVVNYFINDSVAVNLSLLKGRESIDYKANNGSTMSAKIGNTSTQVGIAVFF